MFFFGEKNKQNALHYTLEADRTQKHNIRPGKSHSLWRLLSIFVNVSMATTRLSLSLTYTQDVILTAREGSEKEKAPFFFHEE